MVSPLTSKHFDNVLHRSKRADELGNKIAKALELIESCLASLTEQAVALSFNGGKDCTVLLHLFATALYARHASIPDELRPTHRMIDIPALAQSATTDSMPAISNGEPEPALVAVNDPEHLAAESNLPYPPIKSIYITAPNHFAELDTFTDDSVIRYGMDLYRFGGDMRAALRSYLECGGGKGVKGVLVGTRTGDPNGRTSLSGVRRVTTEIQVSSRSIPPTPTGRNFYAYIRY
jgi:FAD synthetase